MADFNIDREETVNHPRIVEFLSQCDHVSNGGIVTVDMVRDIPLIRYSAHLIILEWKPDKQDFFYRYWGTRLTDVYGLEMTGKYIADGDHRETADPFIESHLSVIREGRKVYLGGTIDWRGKDHQRWNQVAQPLMRDGEINETLTYVTFD